jgi:hypothetical protein
VKNARHHYNCHFGLQAESPSLEEKLKFQPTPKELQQESPSVIEIFLMKTIENKYKSVTSHNGNKLKWRFAV